MKTCLICGTENADDASTCVACGEGTWGEAVVKPAQAVLTATVVDEPATDPDPAPKSRKR